MERETPQYWRSLEELEQTPEFKEGLKKEFLSPPTTEKAFTEMERRDFLKAMGVGMLLTTTACYRRPVEKIIPYVNRPEEVVPGIPDWYTSACGECAAGCGILIKTREGRPIKVEGNESHPLNQGGLCARGQASLLNLYDPDRLKGPVSLQKGASKDISWEDLDKKVMTGLTDAKSQGKKVALLTGALDSPSALKLVQDFLKAYPGAFHVAYEGVVPEEIALAQELSYGQKLTPRYRFDKAKLILSFGADFLGTWLSPVEFAKQFSKARKVEAGSMARFVTVESNISLTGSNADRRYPVKPGDELAVALCLAHELTTTHRLGQGPAALSAYDLDTVSKQTGIPAEELRSLASELSKKQGESLVVGGSKAKNALGLEVAVNLLNSILKNDGVTVDASVAPSNQAQSSFADLKNLIKAAGQGEIGALIIDRSNPVYKLPVSLGFKEALKKIPLVVSFADRVDETGAEAHFIAADGHPFETWGDSNPQKGLYSVAQPALQPMYKTRPYQESLIKWASLPTPSWYEYLKNNWKEAILPQAGAATEAAWEETLQKGFLQASGVNRDGTSGSRSVASSAFQVLESLKPAEDGVTMSLYASVALFDGRAANNGWLQELPDPISKITWDNYLSVSPKLAKKMDLQEGHVVRIQGKGVQAELPVHIQPMLPENTTMAAIGYGRIRAGRLGTSVGRNVHAFQNTEGSVPEWGGHPISISKTGKTERLAATQSHNSFEGRPIILEMNWEEYQKKAGGHAEEAKAAVPAAHGDGAGEGHEEVLPTMWSGHEYTGPYRWGMSVDMNACIGCNACMVGCQSENNVPVVGKIQVLNGREMHWIRIDRYYSGDVDQPEISYQPMLCQHCENAPCETVCPVLATVHNDEGLNMQVYNRCVGTRYCSNNCPYKVRRFNFFDYSKQFKEPLNWALNPDISTRTRGVMEKCTFCVQRIQESKDKAKSQGRKVKDGELKTACQQSCPTDAIVFGNINDPESLVSKMKKVNRGYHVLEDLNVKPQVTYLQKVRNKESV